MLVVNCPGGFLWIFQKRGERYGRHDLIRLLADFKKGGFEVTELFVGAIVALLVKSLRHARLQGYGAVEEAINFRQRDLFRVPQQVVSTARALLALDVSAALEVKQDQLEEFLRDILRSRDLLRQQVSLFVFFSQANQRFQRVLAFFRHHGSNLVSP